jgi:hypothetical protein
MEYLDVEKRHHNGGSSDVEMPEVAELRKVYTIQFFCGMEDGYSSIIEIKVTQQDPQSGATWVSNLMFRFKILILMRTNRK